MKERKKEHCIIDSYRRTNRCGRNDGHRITSVNTKRETDRHPEPLSETERHPETLSETDRHPETLSETERRKHKERQRQTERRKHKESANFFDYQKFKVPLAQSFALSHRSVRAGP